jgi:hypothetical protein
MARDSALAGRTLRETDDGKGKDGRTTQRHPVTLAFACQRYSTGRAKQMVPLHVHLELEEPTP